MSAARVTTTGSEVFAQVHPGVKRGDLVGVPVEHQRLAFEQLTDTPLAGLTPAGMVNIGIYIGVESVLIWSGDVPGRLRRGLAKANLHDRLAAFEAVLPRHDETERRAVLVGQRLSVHSRHHQRKRVAGLIHSQRLDVGPFEDAALLSRHLLRIQESRKLDILRLRGRLQAIDDLGQRDAQPWDDHRPAFYAAHPVDPLDGSKGLQQLVEIVHGGPFYLTGDLDFPRPRAQRTGIARGIVLAGPELVIVIVAGDILPRCELLIVRARWQQGPQRQQPAYSCSTESGRGDEVAPI